MASLRPFFIALAIPASLVACGGGEGVTPPAGPHYTYVANRAFVPTNNNQARDFGLDLNGDKTVDNQLGMVLGTLAGQGFKVQDTIDLAVAQGDIILLVDFQTKDLMNTTGAGLNLKLGAMPMPPACTDKSMLSTCGCTDTTDPIDPTTCGSHLKGTGTFSIAAGSPDNAAVAGKIINGVFTGGPGDISLQIALGGAMPIQLDLIGARAKATGITDSSMSEVILAGALTKADLDSKVIPAVHAQLGPIITRDCTGTAPPDPCGCAANSTGKTIIGLFDTNPKDCTVTIDEIKTNSLIMSLLAPDVTINGEEALSLGIKITTVHGTFPTPE